MHLSPKCNRLYLAILLLAGGSLQIFAAGTLPAGAVAYWPGDGNSLDYAGTNHATLDNGASFAPGQLNDGFTFTNYQSVRIPYSPTLLPSIYTMQAWVNPISFNSNGPGPWGLIFGQRSGPSLQSTPGPSGEFRISMDQYHYGWSSVSGGAIPYNQFTHVLATADGSTIKIYTNGVLSRQGTLPTTRDVNTTPFFIGGYNAPTGDGFFKGTIDEVAVWHRVLSQEEITFLASWRTPQTALAKAVRPLFTNLSPGLNYQLQLSDGLSTWTNHGATFTATNQTMTFPQYWDVDDWGKLFFRLQVTP